MYVAQNFKYLIFKKFLEVLSTHLSVSSASQVVKAKSKSSRIVYQPSVKSSNVRRESDSSQVMRPKPSISGELYKLCPRTVKSSRSAPVKLSGKPALSFGYKCRSHWSASELMEEAVTKPNTGVGAVSMFSKQLWMLRKGPIKSSHQGAVPPGSILAALQLKFSLMHLRGI